MVDEVIDLEEPSVLARPWESESEDESSSSSSSSDTDEMPALNASQRSSASASDPMSVRLYINAKTLVIHERRDAKTFRCGRALGSSYFAVPALNGLRCGKCFAQSL